MKCNWNYEYTDGKLCTTHNRIVHPFDDHCEDYQKIPVIDYSFTEYYVPSPWVKDKIKLIPVRDTLPW